MWTHSPFAVMVGIILFNSINSTPIVNVDKDLKYQEYIIEHEISMAEAKKALQSIDLEEVKIPPGCQNCTKKEIVYCSGTNLISDHCCCDKRFEEALDFIPHTCYLGTQLCQPIIGDCIEYTRVKDCCCNKFARQLWKERSLGSIPKASLLGIIWLTASLFCV